MKLDHHIPDISRRLIPTHQWQSPGLCLLENDDCLHLDLNGALQYSGMNNVGGLVLGFRLVQYAVELTRGAQPMQRDRISICTAFAGQGTQDAFEYTCRAIRDQRYCFDKTLQHPAALTGQRGQFLFIIRVNGQSVVMTPVEGSPPLSYFEADKRSKESTDAALGWRNAKIDFANTLLTLPPEKCLRVL